MKRQRNNKKEIGLPMEKKRIMPENDYQLFRSIAQLDQDQLRNQLFKVLKNRYTKVIANEHFIYAVGEIPIAVLAHMDTVFKAPPKEIYYDTRQNVILSPQGLGADDRAGVFAILKILHAGLKPSIIFTTDEECGGLGAFAIMDKLDKPKTDLKYLIQLDRRGTNDCVFYDCDNKAFVQYVESFGFRENWGTFTDISVICPEWGMAGVNLSIGYLREHSTSEILNVDDMYDTIDKVITMLSEKDIPYFKYIPNQFAYTWDYDGKYVGAHKLYPNKRCFFCGDYFSDLETIPVEIVGEQGVKIVCSDCCLTAITWCPNCDVAFKKGDDDTCPICGFKPAAQDYNYD